MLILNLVLSSIFYIEEMLTIICNFSNGLYFVYLFIVSIVILILKHVLILEHVLNLSCYLTTLIFSYKTVRLHLSRIIFLFIQHSLLDSCAGNIRALNKLYNSTRYFCYHFQIKIAIEPEAFHYPSTTRQIKAISDTHV